jgi:hypothetical protein
LFETHGEARCKACFPKEKTRSDAGLFFWGAGLAFRAS